MTNYISNVGKAKVKALIFGAMLGPTLGFAAPSNLCYVNGAAKGANDGSSWSDAYTNPQFALIRPDKCSEIWVAKGLYKPTLGTDTTVSFVVPSGVTMYGGFAGGETSRDSRVPTINLTIFSGDIDNNDDVNADGVVTNTNDIVGGNSFHVVYLDGELTPITSSTLIDGFIVTGGNALGKGEFSNGGGLYCNGGGNGDRSVCSPTLRNMVFSGNFAFENGGALYAGGSGGDSSPTLIDVTFTANAARTDGGAMYDNGDEGVSSPNLINVFFNLNTALEGGAMYSVGKNLQNSAPAKSSPVLTSVVFANNSAQTGGAMLNLATDGGVSSPVMSVVTFNGNTAHQGDGGAMYNSSDGNGSICSPTIVNSTFSGNKADQNGGAILNISNAESTTRPFLTNVTVSGNTASIGGGIYNSASTSLTTLLLTNVILWADSAPSDAPTNEIGDTDATLSLVQSVVQGGCPIDATVCSNVSKADPKLSALSENGGFTRTMVPQYGSSAIDTGLDSSCPNVDQRGLSRPQGAHCEIGAVEVIPTPPPVADPKNVVIPENTSIQITLTASDSNPGGPFSFTITGAVKHGSVLIADNVVTYRPDTDYTGPDSFSYTATDTNGTSADAIVTILVTSGPPVAKSFSIEIPHNTSASMTVSATDANAGGPFPLTYAVVTSTTHGTVSLSGDTALYTPTHNYTGPDEFTYTATDVNGTSLPATVTIQVDPAPPVADNKIVITPYNTPKQITLSGSDNDNLGGPFALTFSLASSPAHGTLSAISGSFVTYTPNHNYSGSDSFTYTSTDVNGESKPALVQITVLPPGAAPPPSNTTAIPTLSTWGLLALAGLIGVTAVRRRRKI